MEKGFVLDLGGNDMIALLPIHFGDALKREIIGFRGAACKNNFLRLGSIDEACNLSARDFNSIKRFLAKGMIAACGIAKDSPVKRLHRLEHARINRGR